MKWDVSIGIPVYNGEDLLENTLEYLTSHHGDVREIIISDNASTDKTPEICKKYAAKFPFIKYIRQKNYMSAMDNWKEALKPATGKYFMWIGHHDIISDNYFEETVPLLEKNTDAVAAISIVKSFTVESGLENTQTYIDPVGTGIDSDDKRERVYAVLKQWQTCALVNQLFKIDIIRKIADECFIREYVNTDHILAMFATLIGKVMIAPKATYYYWRREGESEDDTMKRYIANSKLASLSQNHKRYIPRMFWELCRKYAADFADELLEKDINFACAQIYGMCAKDEDWIARQISLAPKENAPEARAYSAIYVALKDEELCEFYRRFRFGRKSPFEDMAKQIAFNSYTRMLQILLDEQYLHPVYRLNGKETAMLNKLLTLKAEGATL